MGLMDILGSILGGGNAPSPFSEDPITPRMPQQEQTYSPNMMQSGNQFNVNPSLFSGVGQQASQAAQGVGGQKPLGFLAPYANKIPGMQGLGNMMAADNYKLPKILNSVAGPMMFSNKGGRRTQMYQQSLGDLLAGQSLGGGQQWSGQPQQAQQVAQQPAPQPTAKPSMLPAAEVAPQASPQPTGKGLAPLTGYTPGQSSSQDTMFQPQKPSFSNSQQVSGGTVGSPDTATPPSIEQSPMDMPREITSAVTDAARYTRPTIDPLIAGMMTGIRPGSNPHTGNTAGGDYTRLALTEGDLASKRANDLMKSYAATMEAGNKPLLQYWQGMEHQAKYKQIMGDNQVQQAAGRLKYAETLGEGQAKHDIEMQAMSDLYNSPMLRNMATSPALQKLGIMHMGQVAALAKTGDARVLSEIERSFGQLQQAQISASSRIQAAGISAGAHERSAANTARSIDNQILRAFGTEVNNEIKAIESRFYDPKVTKKSDPITLNKSPMSEDMSLRLTALRGTQAIITKGYESIAKDIGGVGTTSPTDPYKPGTQTQQPAAPQRKPDAIGDEAPTKRRRVPTAEDSETAASGGRIKGNVKIRGVDVEGYKDLTTGKYYDKRVGGKVIAQ